MAYSCLFLIFEVIFNYLNLLVCILNCTANIVLAKSGACASFSLKLCLSQLQVAAMKGWPRLPVHGRSHHWRLGLLSQFSLWTAHHLAPPPMDLLFCLFSSWSYCSNLPVLCGLPISGFLSHSSGTCPHVPPDPCVSVRVTSFQRSRSPSDLSPMGQTLPLCLEPVRVNSLRFKKIKQHPPMCFLWALKEIATN